MRQLLAAAFALSFCVTSIAQISLGAQYQWVDRNGQMVFSDQPPPATVPLSRILRVGDPVAPPSKRGTPGAASVPSAPGAPSTSASEQVALAAAKPEPAAKTARQSLRERMLAFDERRAKRKQDRRKQVNQAKRAKSAAKSCKRMRASKAKLDSGRRLRTRNKEGVMVPMTETDRSTHTKALTKRLKKCRA